VLLVDGDTALRMSSLDCARPRPRTSFLGRKVMVNVVTALLLEEERRFSMVTTSISSS
jgi:hypothetical protein